MVISRQMSSALMSVLSASWYLEPMAPRVPRMPGPTSFFSMTRTFAPFSAAEQAAKRPEVPAPTTRTSQSSVSTMSPSATSGAVPSHAGASAASAAGAWSASARAGAQARVPAAEAVAMKPRRETFEDETVMVASLLMGFGRQATVHIEGAALRSHPFDISNHSADVFGIPHQQFTKNQVFAVVALLTPSS